MPASPMSRRTRSNRRSSFNRPPNARFERESFGALQQMLAALPAADQAATWDEIEQQLRAFEIRGGFEAPTELVVGAGTK